MESKRLAQQIENIYNGSPWLGLSIIDILKDVTPELAARKPEGKDTNSIWILADHIAYWRITVYGRLTGNNPELWEDFSEHTEITQEEWNKTLARLEESQKLLLQAVKDFDENKLDLTYREGATSYYNNIQGALQHDAYHMGQIMLLKKLFLNI